MAEEDISIEARRILEKLKKIATDPYKLITEREKAQDALAELGEASVPFLLDIADNRNLLVTERERAMGAVKRMIEEAKSKKKWQELNP